MHFAFEVGPLLLLCFSVAQSKDNEESSSESESFRLDLWSKGLFDIDETLVRNDLFSNAARMAPVSYVRRDVLEKRESEYCDMTGFCYSPPYVDLRGGADAISASEYERHMEKKIELLGAKFGKEFLDAIEQNKIEHEEDCQKSCEIYYCASPDAAQQSMEELMGDTTIKSYSMGPVPPEDFAESFGFPLDIIKVTETVPLFDAKEAAGVVQAAEAEGVHENEFNSGKYKLAGTLEKQIWYYLDLIAFPLMKGLQPRRLVGKFAGYEKMV